MEELAPWEQELQDSFDDSEEACDETSRFRDGTYRFSFKVSGEIGQAIRQAAKSMDMDHGEYLVWCHQAVAQNVSDDVLLKTAFGPDYEATLGMVEATVLGARE